MIKNCNNCGKEFCKKSKEGFLDWNERKFCSLECSWIGRKTKIGYVNSEHTRKLISESKKGKYLKENNPFYGKKHTDKTKKILSDQRIGVKTGAKHHNWKGGITSINCLLRASYKYKQWRKSVYEKDNYICVDCGYDKGRILEADHINPFSKIIEKIILEFGLNNLYENAINYNELWDISNGRTLCKPCHEKTDTFAGRISNKLLKFNSN